MTDFDLALSRHELAEYGIGYVDESDALYIGRRFIRNPGLAQSLIAHVAPSQILALLYSTNGLLVGVKITWVSYLMGYYWNGKIPNFCPACWISDLADQSLDDPDSIVQDLNAKSVMIAMSMHEDARKLVSELENIPPEILERIQDNNLYCAKRIN